MNYRSFTDHFVEAYTDGLYTLADATGGKLTQEAKATHKEQCTQLMEKAIWQYAHKVMTREKPADALQEKDMPWIRKICLRSCDATMSRIPIQEAASSSGGDTGPITQAPPPPPKGGGNSHPKPPPAHLN